MKTTFNELFEISFNTTKEYLKAQLIMITITFAILSLGFALLEIKLWFLWAFLLAIVDIIPIVGTGLFIIPWAIICFFTGDTSLGGWLLGLYFALVLIRQIVEPLIIGKKIGLNPLITFGVTIIGSIIMGPIGFILAPIVAAIIKAVIRHENIKNSSNNS